MIIGDDEVGKGDGKYACCISAWVWWIEKIVLSFYLPFALSFVDMVGWGQLEAISSIASAPPPPLSSPYLAYIVYNPTFL